MAMIDLARSRVDRIAGHPGPTLLLWGGLLALGWLARAVLLWVLSLGDTPAPGSGPSPGCSAR